MGSHAAVEGIRAEEGTPPVQVGKLQVQVGTLAEEGIPEVGNLAEVGSLAAEGIPAAVGTRGHRAGIHGHQRHRASCWRRAPCRSRHAGLCLLPLSHHQTIQSKNSTV